MGIYPQPKPAKIRKFKGWLSANGALVLAATNPYEIVRFQSESGVSLVYINRHGSITSMTGDSSKAWDAFCRGLPWNGAFKTPRRCDAKKRHDLVTELLKRDGMTCMYCGEPINIESATIEHVVPLSRGGKNSIENMALACKDCNNAAGNMNVRQKIELAISKRKQKGTHYE